MNKTGNPYTEVVKRQHIHGLICFNYENKVNREMPEGYKDFQAGQRVWGNRLGDTPLVEHKGEFYLEVLPIKELEPPRYYLKGVQIPAEAVAPFLKGSPEVLVRPKDFRISGIREIKIGGQELCISHT